MKKLLSVYAITGMTMSIPSGFITYMFIIFFLASESDNPMDAYIWFGLYIGTYLVFATIVSGVYLLIEKIPTKVKAVLLLFTMAITLFVAKSQYILREKLLVILLAQGVWFVSAFALAKVEKWSTKVKIILGALPILILVGTVGLLLLNELHNAWLNR